MGSHAQDNRVYCQDDFKKLVASGGASSSAEQVTPQSAGGGDSSSVRVLSRSQGAVVNYCHGWRCVVVFFSRWRLCRAHIGVLGCVPLSQVVVVV